MTEHYKNCIVLLNVGEVIDLTSLKAIEGVQAIMLVGDRKYGSVMQLLMCWTAKTIPSGKLTDVYGQDLMRIIHPLQHLATGMEILTTNITVMESMWDIVILIRLCGCLILLDMEKLYRI